MATVALSAFGRIPYRVIYRVEKEAVFIIAIVHGAQDLKRFMRNRRRK
jgi:plasmid stabilization system protein ParE